MNGLIIGSGLCVVVKNYSTHTVKISNGLDEVKLFNGLYLTKENLFFLKPHQCKRLDLPLPKTRISG